MKLGSHEGPCQKIDFDQFWLVKFVIMDLLLWTIWEFPRACYYAYLPWMSSTFRTILLLSSYRFIQLRCSHVFSLSASRKLAIISLLLGYTKSEVLELFLIYYCEKLVRINFPLIIVAIFALCRKIIRSVLIIYFKWNLFPFEWFVVTSSPYPKLNSCVLFLALCASLLFFPLCIETKLSIFTFFCT